MYTNTSCTLYLKEIGYKKIVIKKCFLTQTSLASATKQGLSYSENAKCLFIGNEDLKFTNGEDLLIRGESNVEINEADEKSISEGMDTLIKNGAYTIMESDYKNYGSHSMRHWELSCK